MGLERVFWDSCATSRFQLVVRWWYCLFNWLCSRAHSCSFQGLQVPGFVQECMATWRFRCWRYKSLSSSDQISCLYRQALGASRGSKRFDWISSIHWFALPRPRGCRWRKPCLQASRPVVDSCSLSVYGSCLLIGVVTLRPLWGSWSRVELSASYSAPGCFGFIFEELAFSYGLIAAFF